MKSPPELVIVKRESCGKGEPVPRVQLMRGWGCPETPHSKVTLSPISTSVFCGWITKVGLAARKQVLQKPEALLPPQLWAEIAWTPHAAQLAAARLFPDLQILHVRTPPVLLLPTTSPGWSLSAGAPPAPVSPSPLIPLSRRIHPSLQTLSPAPNYLQSLNPQFPTPMKEPPKAQTTLHRYPLSSQPEMRLQEVHKTQLHGVPK